MICCFVHAAADYQYLGMISVFKVIGQRRIYAAKRICLGKIKLTLKIAFFRFQILEKIFTYPL